MIGLSSALSLKKPGTMSTAELATRAQVGKSAVLLTIGHHDIPGLFGNAKNGLSGVFA